MKILSNANISLYMYFIIYCFNSPGVLANTDKNIDKQICENILTVTIEKYSGVYKKKLDLVKTVNEFNFAVKYIYSDVLKTDKQVQKCIRVDRTIYNISDKKSFKNVVEIIREVGEVNKAVSILKGSLKNYSLLNQVDLKKHYESYKSDLIKIIEHDLNNLNEKKNEKGVRLNEKGVRLDLIKP